jgi:Dolichyl-phosphate-mannose-protein mannosyltransferase
LGESLAIRLLPIALSGALVFLVGAMPARRRMVRAGACSNRGFTGATFPLRLSRPLDEQRRGRPLGARRVAGFGRSANRSRLAVAGIRRHGCVGLLTKHSMAVFGLGIFAGLLVTPARRLLKTPWPWAGGVVAALLFAPHLWWQHTHGWPTAEFVRNAQEFKIAEHSIHGSGFMVQGSFPASLRSKGGA